MTARTTTIVRRSLAPSLLAAVAFGAAACGSTSAPSTGGDGPAILPAENTESEALGGRLLGEFTVHYVASTGKLEFTRLDRGPLVTKGFTQVADGNITFTTTAAITGPGTYAGGTCNANQLCAQVNVANGTGVAVETLWVGVTSISNATVANGDAVPTGYGIVPSAGAWNYGNIATSGNATKEWRFNYTGDFSFNVAVFGTFTRTSYTFASTTPTSVNACTLGGTRVLDNSALYGGDLNNASDTLTFPFPVTIFGTTRTSGYVTTNGVLGLISANTNPANATLKTYSTSMPRPALFPFWDDLKAREGHGICYATTGSAPSRSFVVTWDDFCFNSTSDNCGSAGNGSHMTFSVVFHEGDDDFEFYYQQMDAPSSWNGSQKRRLRGNSATIGVNGLVGSAYSYKEVGSDGNTLPSTPAPYQLSFNALPNNPAAK